jgi:hypothetical protein
VDSPFIQECHGMYNITLSYHRGVQNPIRRGRVVSTFFHINLNITILFLDGVFHNRVSF